MAILRVDYVSMTLPASARQALAGVFAEVFGTDFTCAAGMQHYAESLRWSNGSKILFGGDYQNDTCHAIIPGQACAECNPLHLLRVLVNDYKLPVKLTRLDIALDVPGSYTQAVEQNIGLYAYQMRSALFIQKYSRARELIGCTFYWGSRTSDRMLRVYDKMIDELPYTRFEVELKGAWAETMLKAILGLSSLSSLAGSAFSRLFKIEAFTNLLDHVTPFKPYKARVSSRRLDWLLNCSGAVQDVLEAYGVAYVLGEIVQKNVRRGTTPNDNMGVKNWSEQVRRLELLYPSLSS